MNQKISTKLGIIIIVIMAVTIGMFAWKIEKNQPEPEQQMQNNQVEYKQQKEKTSQLEEIGKDNTSISTANWKSYTNKQYNYSIKYPETWLIKTELGSEKGLFLYEKELVRSEQSYVHDISFGNVLSDNVENLRDISGDYFINISVYPEIGTHENLKEWRKYDGNSYQEVLIDGNLALKFNEGPHKSYDGKNKDMAGSLRYYFIDKNNKGYEITVWYKDTSSNMGEKIISTLRLYS